MPIPVRSIRLQRRSSQSLDTLSGASGEIFFDSDRNTLRLYTANQANSIILADRVWVEENTFSGDYNDLINTPSIPGDVSQLSDNFSLLFSGDYNDLTNAPDLDSLNIDISTLNSIGDVDTETEPLVNGQLLQWDGEKWQNATVGGFADTTYDLELGTITGGVSLTLTGSDETTDIIELVGAGNTTVGLNLSNQLEVSTSVSLGVSDLSDTAISNPQDGQSLIYNSGQWINANSAGAVTLGSFSATNDTASGNGSLSYDNSTGTFTFTPPDLSTYATLGSFSVSTNAASGGGSLNYSSGSFTFRPADLSSVAALTSFSVATNPASGGGSLSYNNSTGVFTFTPSAGGDIVSDTTPQLGGDLDLNSNDITGTGNISITGSVSADSFSSSATGAPSVTSASTITLTAPDGIITNGAIVGNTTNLTITAITELDCTDTSFFSVITNSLGTNYTINFTNLPIVDGSNKFAKIVFVDFSTGTGPTNFQINGSSQSVGFPGGPPSSFTGIYMIEFIFFSSGGGNVTVLANYITGIST